MVEHINSGKLNPNHIFKVVDRLKLDVSYNSKEKMISKLVENSKVGAKLLNLFT